MDGKAMNVVDETVDVRGVDAFRGWVVDGWMDGFGEGVKSLH